MSCDILITDVAEGGVVCLADGCRNNPRLTLGLRPWSGGLVGGTSLRQGVRRVYGEDVVATCGRGLQTSIVVPVVKAPEIKIEEEIFE